MYCEYWNVPSIHQGSVLGDHFKMSNRMFRRNLTVRALLLVSAILLSSVLLAQNDTAVLSGRVLDPSGLGVPGAHVRLTKQSTGAIRETLTAMDGAYRVELIEPGDYSLHVAANGFKTQEYSAIHLQVDRGVFLRFEAVGRDVQRIVAGFDQFDPVGAIHRRKRFANRPSGLL